MEVSLISKTKIIWRKIVTYVGERNVPEEVHHVSSAFAPVATKDPNPFILRAPEVK